MNTVWILKTEDDGWFLGIDEYGEYECLIHAEDAIQFVRAKDAGAFLKFFNNIGLDTSDCFQITTHRRF